LPRKEPLSLPDPFAERKVFPMANGICFNEKYPDITQSNKLYNRALRLIPSQTQTLAKGAGQYIKGIAPKYLLHGDGSHVWDVDGNEFIDYNMGIGPLSLGYCYPAVNDAIREQLLSGITFSMMHPLEVEVAEFINTLVPNAEMVRFSKTGADVTSAAVRLARAFTKRTKVLCCGYHGWHDWYISVTDRRLGIPREISELTHTFQYNDIQSVLDSIDDDTACIILEPAVFEEPKDNFLHRLKDICEQNGSLLIFDEMWTGFRAALGGAQEYFGVKADLATFSKAVANGMPLSVLTGRADVMQRLEKDVFFFTTFGGETLSLAAAKATILEMVAKKVPDYLAAQGKKLRLGFDEIVRELNIPFLSCKGLDCRTMIIFDPSAGNTLALKSFMQQELFKRGILWGGFHNLSFSHTDDDIDYTLIAYRDVLKFVKKVVEENTVLNNLRGEIIEPVFRRTGNFNTKPKIEKE
jgi:glutamate-1-semialdehyde aminotransferase